MTRVSVIVATLGRPELRRLLDSLQQQTLSRVANWQLLVWTKQPGEGNEYWARNKLVTTGAKGEVLCFLDDDTYVKPDYLEKGLEHFDGDHSLMVMGARMILQGQPRLDMPECDPGACLWARKSAFMQLGGFEATWGLPEPPPVRGWRGDTDFIWRAIAAGMKYEHWNGIDVFHPEGMKAHWDPRVERLFYERHKKKCIEILLPWDLRMPLYMMAFEKDLSLRERAAIKVEEHTKAGYYKKEDVPAMIEEMKGLMGK